MDSFFADCGSASVAVQTAALAAVATALAALAFVSAYILRTVRRWQVWSGSTNPPSTNDD